MPSNGAEKVAHSVSPEHVIAICHSIVKNAEVERLRFDVEVNVQ